MATLVEALPVLSKSWQYDINNSIAAQGTTLATNKLTLRSIKNSMKNISSSPWTVVGSSNAVTAGMDGVDRWAADSDVVWASAGAHSWIVLKQTGISSTFHLVFDLLFLSTSSQSLGVFFSATGFSGGTTSARPTASDSVSLGTVVWGGLTGSGADGGCRYHYTQSTDGECSRLYIFRSGNCVSRWDISRVKEPVIGWATPYYIYMEGTGGSTETVLLSTINSTANNRYYSLSPLVTSGGGHSTTIGGKGSPAALATRVGISLINNKYPMYPMRFSVNSGVASGSHGHIYDMWFAAITVTATGDAYPAGGSRQFVNINDIIIPWNGASLSTS